ncbi:MAG: type II toxin-antitoxin system HigB family toxin [Bacteroidota bacterium]|jgi:mRNA interferase HigB
MRIIGRDKLDDFKKKHPDACSQIDSWEADVEEADWSLTQDVRQRYGSASFLGNNQAVFNIKGNKYRLLTQINYKSKIVLVLKAGTHQEYMNW